MKITDEKLLDAIWENQLRCLSESVTHKYTCGGHGLVEDDGFWFRAASGEHTASRQRVTKLINKPQLLARIRRLALSGEIDFSNGLTFYIDGDQAISAFKAARAFWLSNGVPEGRTKGRSNTAVVDFYAIAAACFSHLRKLYPSRQRSGGGE